MTMILFVLLLSVIICIHEAGHLLAAKKFGVYCFEYAFGMGPAIFRKKGKETVYSIRAIPVGGFVAMAGEQDGDEAYPEIEVPEGRRLGDQAVWKRIIIMLAGVTMNFLLAWIIFSMLILHNGVFVQSPPPVVEEVVAGSPAEQAGFEPGDRIVKVKAAGGASIKPDSYLDLQMFLSQYAEEEMTYTVSRNGATETLVVQAEYDEEQDAYRIGIVGSSASLTDINFLNCWRYGLAEMGMIMRLMVSTILALFKGSGLDQLSGPVGIYNATEEYAALGAASYLFLIGELSLNVGIFNLLPLPVLDGGQVVLLLGEAVAGRKLNEKVKMGLMGACWVMLISVMVYATWNDIIRLFG
ncbi:MAG: RIP metalloprotease RseP [Solobacterium sp.]|nr:RIP metalloprotease RseP [Solobacterium sp.]